jgi:cellulose synthase/poly-beta-1,6-N-acetylglucosamine synthase-like glycosyltransferase
LNFKELPLKQSHKVSVIVRACGRGPELDRCLCSLCCQDYINYEIIVIDNAPENPRTRQIVNCFEGITYVPEYRKAMRFIRQTAAAVASGDILAYIDGNCVADPKWISSIVSNLKLDENATAWTSAQAKSCLGSQQLPR